MKMEMFCLANDIFFPGRLEYRSKLSYSDLPERNDERQDKMPRRTYVVGGGVEPVLFWRVTVD
jgi:hypothetical protein